MELSSVQLLANRLLKDHELDKKKDGDLDLTEQKEEPVLVDFLRKKLL